MSEQFFSQHLQQSLSSKKTFDEWAVNYDEEVKSVDYQAPKIVTEIVLELISSGFLLDIGCGTGLVAQSLKDKNNNITIDGCDYSQPMIEIAASKNVYRSLSCCDIMNMPFKDSSYDAITCVGVFSTQIRRKQKGSPDAEALCQIVRILKPNGYLFFTLSQRVLDTDSQHYESAIASLPVRLIKNETKKYHKVIPSMQCIVLQKI